MMMTLGRTDVNLLFGLSRIHYLSIDPFYSCFGDDDGSLSSQTTVFENFKVSWVKTWHDVQRRVFQCLGVGWVEAGIEKICSKIIPVVLSHRPPKIVRPSTGQTRRVGDLVPAVRYIDQQVCTCLVVNQTTARKSSHRVIITHPSQLSRKVRLQVAFPCAVSQRTHSARTASAP